MIIVDNLGEFNIDIDVIKTLIVYNKKQITSGKIDNSYRVLTYQYDDKSCENYPYKMTMSTMSTFGSKILWEWSGGFIEENIYNLCYVIVKSLDRKVIFLGDRLGGCNAFLDYDTGVELDWSIACTNKKVADFVSFIMEGLYYNSSRLYSPPEQYKNILSVPCFIPSFMVLDVLDNPNHKFKHTFLI